MLRRRYVSSERAEDVTGTTSRRKSALHIFIVAVHRQPPGSMSSRDYLSAINHRATIDAYGGRGRRPSRHPRLDYKHFTLFTPTAFLSYVSGNAILSEPSALSPNINPLRYILRHGENASKLDTNYINTYVNYVISVKIAVTFKM